MDISIKELAKQYKQSSEYCLKKYKYLLCNEEEIIDLMEEFKFYKKLERKTKISVSLYKAINIFGKKEVKKLCEEHIMTNNDTENYKQILSLCNPTQFERIDTEQYNSIPMTNVLDACGIEHRFNRCACPLHQGSNKTAFHIRENDNTYKCYRCGEWGKPIDFVMKYHRYTFLQSINFLKSCL